MAPTNPSKIQPQLALALIAAIFVGLAERSGAQESEAGPGAVLDEVVVTGTRSENRAFDLPFSSNVVRASDLQHTGAPSLGELLWQVAGLEFDEGPTELRRQPYLRGYAGNEVMVMVDGARQNFEAGHLGRAFVDPLIVKKVEVVKGPMSALYGSGGLGGVIAIETKDAADFLRDGETKGALTQLGFQSVNSQWTASQVGFARSEKSDVLVNVSLRDSKETKLSRGADLGTEFTNFSALAKLSYFADDATSLVFTAGGLQSDGTEPGAQGGPDENIDRSAYVLNGKLVYDPPSRLVDLEAHGYVTRTAVDYAVAATTRAPANREIATFGGGVVNRSLLQTGGLAHRLSYGADFFSDKAEDSAGGQLGAIESKGAGQFLGVYLQDEISFELQNQMQLLLIPGLRYDSFSSEDASGANRKRSNELSPKIGVSLKPSPGLLLFANYAKAFRAPDISDRFRSGIHFPAAGPGNFNRFVGNLELKPETSTNFEIGFGLALDESLRLKVARFSTSSKDYIDTVITTVGTVPNPDFNRFQPPTAPGGGNSPVLLVGCGFIPNTDFNQDFCNTRSVNRDRAEIWGIEGELEYLSGGLTAQLGYAQITGTAQDGSYLGSLQPAKLKAHLAYAFADRPLTVGIRSVLAAKFDKVNDAADERQGYGKHDVYVNWQPSRKLAAHFAIDNVLNKAYQTANANAYGKARNFKVVLSYRW